MTGESKALLTESSSPKPSEEGTANQSYASVGNGGNAFEEEGDDDDNDEFEPVLLSLGTLFAILSTAFSYGCIFTTLFLITLPIECERINQGHPEIPKSVALGAFVAIAGLTQLISPLVGRLSDIYQPPPSLTTELGQRLPYLMMGSVVTVIGLLGQMFSSSAGFWVRYSVAFFLHMIGLNVMYAMMIALIPDQVPASQTGIANGVLAFLLVMGSLFGFGLFHTILAEDIRSMYGLYTCSVIVTSVLTGTHAHDRDVAVTYARIQSDRQRQGIVLEDNPQPIVKLSTPSPVLRAGSRKRPRWHKVARRAGRRARQVALTPAIVLKSMVDPLATTMNGQTLYRIYTIDTTKHHDFCVVTLSRLFYYCGMSVQTFFLYFCHDVIGIRENPEAAVATLAILGQISGALTCYPVGLASDMCLGGRRKPFVYLACAILSSCTASLIFARNMQEMIVFVLIFGGANGMYLTMETSLAVDTLPTAEEFNESMNDEDRSGAAQLLGIWGVAAFLGSALGPMIGGPLLYFLGSTDSGPDAPEEYTLAGYTVVLILSSVYFLCSALSLQWIRKSS